MILIFKENKSFLEIICEDNHKIEISNIIYKISYFLLDDYYEDTNIQELMEKI